MLPGNHPATVAKYCANHYAATSYLWLYAFGAKKSRLFGQIRTFGLQEANLAFSGLMAGFVLPRQIFGFSALDFLRRHVIGFAARYGQAKNQAARTEN